MRTSVAFRRPTQLQAQAEEMLSAIMQELSYVGVMAVRCFVTPQSLLINELVRVCITAVTGRKRCQHQPV